MQEKRFPIYLKTEQEKSYYRIESERELLEYQIIGKKYLVHKLLVSILPERNLLQDLIRNESGRWIEIQEEEFGKMQDFCKENLIEIK